MAGPAKAALGFERLATEETEGVAAPKLSSLSGKLFRANLVRFSSGSARHRSVHLDWSPFSTLPFP